MPRRPATPSPTGYNILILSDRGVDADARADPGLLADGRRASSPDPRGHAHARAAWSSRAGEPREVHHFALLLGYGAGAINPYLAFETLDDMIRQGLLAGHRRTTKAVKNYIKALNKGVLKVMSKMGISTLRATAARRSSRRSASNKDVRRQVLHLDRRRASAASAST